jgi:hypothetical protein
MKALRNIGIVIGGILSVILVLLMIVGTVAPETYIYLGRQVPKKFVTEMRALELLADNEKIKYFYTDAFFTLKAASIL